MLIRTEKRGRDRSKFRKPNSIRIVSAVAATTTITITFDQPVTLMRGVLPQYTPDVVGVTLASAVMTSPTVMVLTYSASVAAATELTIGVQDAAVRNAAGGYVADTTFPV